MSGEDSKFPTVIVVAMLGVGFMLGALLGMLAGEDVSHDRAVKEGHAIWEANERGEATFKWLPPCAPKKEEAKPCQKP